MTEQTIPLLASWNSDSSSRVQWFVPHGSRPAIASGLSGGNTRLFASLTCNSSGSINLRFASNQAETASDANDDLSSIFETSGGFDITVSSFSLSVNLVGVDSTEPYIFTPTNSVEVTQFVSDVRSLSGNPAATLVLRDFVPFDGDAEPITWTFNVGEATGSTVAPVSANAEPITWTFNVGSATGATLAAIPAPTLLQPSSNQVGAIGTTTEYFVTFQYDDNSSFTSPSTVYDTVKSSSHSASWTPPSGFTYIRARFTTLIRDGGTRGAWSDTITYGTAPSFDGDAEAITWSFNVGSATGEATIPEVTADAEPITWTFNVGEATGSTTAPTVQLQLDDIDDTGIVTYVKMLVTSGIAESSGTVYKNNGSLGVLESGSDDTLATGNDISRIALNIDGNLGDMRFWANPNFFTDKPNALVRMQFAPAGPIYEFPFLNHGSNYSNFRNVAAASALTAAQTAGERFLLVVYQFPEFDADAEPITWTFNVGSATGSTVAPSFNADAEPITWTFNIGSATGEAEEPVASLALSDRIIPADTDTVFAGLIEVGVDGTTRYRYDGAGDSDNEGSLVGGDAQLTGTLAIEWLRVEATRVILNRRTTSDQFDAQLETGQPLNNATLYLQDAGGAVSVLISDIDDAQIGGGFFDVRTSITGGQAFRDKLNALGTGDRLILSMTQPEAASEFDGDAEAITWTFNIGSATGSTVAPEFTADAEPITWTFNVGSATGSTVAPSFNADAEPITWTFNIGSATGEAEEPVASLALSDRIIPADTDTVFAGLIEVGVDGTTRYRYDGAGDSDNEGSLVGGDAQLTGTLAIEWLRVEATRVILNRRTTSDQFDAQLETGQPLNNATLYLQDAGGAVSVLISDIDDAQIGGGFFDVRTSITGGQAFRDKLNALGTGDRLILSMTQPEAASEFDGDAEAITWTFNIGSATGSTVAPEFTADAEPITWTFNVGSATGATTAPEFSANAEAITWSFNLGTATGSLVNVALPSERAILDARALTGVDQIYALEISHSALSQSIKIVGDIIEHEIESNTYLPLMFQAEIPQSKEGEIRQATIRIDNIGYELMQWVNDTQGGRDAVIRAMMVVSPEGTETESTIIWEVTMNCGVTEITNEYVIVTLTDEPVFDRPSVLLRHDPSVSPGLF